MAVDKRLAKQADRYDAMAHKMNAKALAASKANQKELCDDLGRAAAALTRAAQTCRKLAFPAAGYGRQ